MSGANFSEMLKQWEGSTVIIINPESYSLGQLGDKITFESYEVTLTAVAGDYLHISFARPKKGEEAGVEQYIPLGMVKRVSVWGNQKYIQV